jgi:PhnB protein
MLTHSQNESPSLGPGTKLASPVTGKCGGQTKFRKLAQIYSLKREDLARRVSTQNLCRGQHFRLAVNFYQKAFGFDKRGIMNGPDSNPMHA